MRIDRVLAAAGAIALMALVASASHLPLRQHPPGGALLRLAWSARPERIEHCRTRSADELARLPAHMRQAVECEGVTASYRLVARHGGSVVADRIVSAGGLRQDRPLYVLEEIPIPAGEALIEVRFERVESPGSTAGLPEQSAAAGAPARGHVVPARLVFAERRRVAAHTALLISYDPTRRELVGLP